MPNIRIPGYTTNHSAGCSISLGEKRRHHLGVHLTVYYEGISPIAKRLIKALAVRGQQVWEWRAYRVRVRGEL